MKLYKIYIGENWKVVGNKVTWKSSGSWRRETSLVQEETSILVVNVLSSMIRAEKVLQRLLKVLQ